MDEPFLFPDIPEGRKRVLEPGQSIEVNIEGLYFGWCDPCAKVVLALPGPDCCPHCSREVEYIRDVDLEEDRDP